VGLNTPPDYSVSPCPACGRRTGPFLTTRDWEYGLPGYYHIYKCAGCGTGWTEPQLSDEEVGALYPAGSYYAFAEPKPVRVSSWLRAARGAGASRWRRALASIFRVVLNRRYYGVPQFVSSGRLLDVGAGTGTFVALAEELGWDAVGVEANPSAAARARGAGRDVRTGSGETLANVTGLRFNYFRFHHVLEHMAAPEKALRAAAALAEPGARLLAAVPNIGGAGAKLFRRYWYHWAVPFHRRHFDRRTLINLLRQTGWTPVRVFYVSNVQGFTRSWAAFLADRAGIKLRWQRGFEERLVQTVMRPLLLALDLWGWGDNVVVEATLAPPLQQRKET